jgi:16S rRNA (guanine966-N2)-methyltransferase
MLRIIAGKHKNRIIPKVKNAKCRPSTSKFKEAVFSILTSGEFIENDLFSGDAHVLDLFSGTGSYGFEAISRGVKSATLIDINSDCIKLAQGFAELIGEKHNINFLHLNALSLPKSNRTYDLVFIDPPYHNNFVTKAIDSLIKGSWVSSGTLIVAELGQKDDISLQDNIFLLKQKTYGNSKLLILKYGQA